MIISSPLESGCLRCGGNLLLNAETRRPILSDTPGLVCSEVVTARATTEMRVAMANTAGVLGKTAAQQEHMADAAATLAAFTAIWYTPSTMTVASGTQSTFAMALWPARAFEPCCMLV